MYEICGMLNAIYIVSRFHWCKLCLRDLQGEGPAQAAPGSVER